MYSLWHYHCLSPAVIITQQVGLLHCLMGTSPVIHPMTSVLCTSLVSHFLSPLKSLLGTLTVLCCALQASLGKGCRVAELTGNSTLFSQLSHLCIGGDNPPSQGLSQGES